MRTTLSAQMRALALDLSRSMNGTELLGDRLRTARALRTRGLATMVRRLRAETSLSGNPLKRERWRLTAKGRRLAAELGSST